MRRVGGANVLLDANLLVLLVVGGYDSRLVGRGRLDVFGLNDLVMLRRRIGGYRWHPASTICSTESFLRLGLTDAAIVQLASDQTAVCSMDSELCDILRGRGVPITNFNHDRFEL